VTREITEGQLRYLEAKRDYFHACRALTALTNVVTHLYDRETEPARAALQRAIGALESVQRPIGCLPSCETLAALLSECTTETKRAAFALTRKRYPAWRPKCLEDLLEVAAVVCLEELMGVDAGEWMNEGGEG